MTGNLRRLEFHTFQPLRKLRIKRTSPVVQYDRLTHRGRDSKRRDHSAITQQDAEHPIKIAVSVSRYTHVSAC